VVRHKKKAPGVVEEVELRKMEEAVEERKEEGGASWW
jgi:hypothetical protein